jgi:hypothetical protein
MAKHALLTVESFRNSFEPPLNRSFVYRLIEESKISVIRPKNKMFIRAEEVDRFLNGGEAK